MSRRPSLLLLRNPDEKDDLVADNIDIVEARLNTHEAVCAERYAGINARLKRIEGWFVAAIGSVIALLITILLKVGHLG